jgi:hypothetical protein
MQSSHARTSLPPHRSSTSQQEEHAEQSHAPLSSTKPTTAASCRAGPRGDLALPPGTVPCCPSLQSHLSPRLRLPGRLGAHTTSTPLSHPRRDRTDSPAPRLAAVTRHYCELPVPPAGHHPRPLPPPIKGPMSPSMMTRTSQPLPPLPEFPPPHQYRLGLQSARRRRSPSTSRPILM